MQKIVVDTNVIVASIIQKGFPYFIMNDLFIEQHFKLCISQELITAY